MEMGSEIWEQFKDEKRTMILASDMFRRSAFETLQQRLEDIQARDRR